MRTRDGLRRLRLGKTFFGAHVPPFPRGLRPQNASRAVSQRLWPVGHLVRRPRKSACRHLQKSHRSEAQRQTRNRNLGSGEQTRSFMYIDRLREWNRSHHELRDSRSDQSWLQRAVTVNQLVDIVEDIAGIKLQRKYDLSAPKRRKRTQLRQTREFSNSFTGNPTLRSAPGLRNLPLDLRPVSRSRTRRCRRGPRIIRQPPIRDERGRELS